jgi:hypothetical protein
VACFCAAAALVVVTGCGGGSGGGSGARGHGPGSTASGSHGPTAPEAGPTAAPTPNAPVPRGKGSKLPGDLDGDGYPDLQIPLFFGQGDAHSRVAFVHGSARGLDPETATVLGRRDLGFPADDLAVEDDDIGSVTTADLDGDGYADVVGVSVEQRDKAAAERTHYADQTLPYIAWGGPGGPGHGTPATRLLLTGPDDGLGHAGMVVGDFNGDGHQDLAASREDAHALFVFYGPVSRTGHAARIATYPDPLGDGREIGALVADTVDGARPTSLAVRAGDDDEQSASVLLTAGPAGLSRTGRPLRKGNQIAFGDFDGDGKRDVAVADSGTRNDEPGYETEAPDVDHTLTVYPGSGAGAVSTRVPGISGRTLTAVDPDGDGKDALAVPLASGGAELMAAGPSGFTRLSTLTRTGPATVGGKKVRPSQRPARLFTAQDFDHDGKDELVLAWGRNVLFTLYGERPDTYWVTDGSHDETVFATTHYVPDPSGG